MDIIEGKNPVIEALKAGRPISKILLDNSLRVHGAADQIIRLAKIKGVEIEYLNKQAMDRQSATGSYQGVMALAAAKKYIGLSDLPAISEAKKEPALYLVLDGIEDPHNLGAILRTADAAGVHAVVIRERRAVGITPAVTKASAGAVEYVPVAMVSNIAQSIETFKKNGVWTVGIDMEGETNYGSVDFTLPTAIVIGGEGKGLSELVRKRCDFIASIPMKGQISSLNASVAAAVVMYEALRQRTPQR
jgi:23S rRNA (guanosine2251-2'-O)-methyltransferase